MKTLLAALVFVAAILTTMRLPAAESGPLRPIGTMGKGENALKGGREAVLFEHQGRGCLNHFWFGGNFKGVENTRIRYYVDGEKEASIDMQLYMGHGIGFNDNQAPWATKYIGKIGKGNGIYNNYQIPFGKSIKVTAQRAADAEDNPRVWWIIRGAENQRAMLGGRELPATARLRLSRLEGYAAKPLEEFDLVKVAGKGALFQVAIAGESGSYGYLEACMRAYLEGSDKPLMLSSGLEDYFLGTYYFDSGRFHADIAGLTSFSPPGRFSAYRFHDADPLFFEKGMRLTCRCGETAHGTKEGPAHGSAMPTRYTTYAWVYEW